MRVYIDIPSKEAIARVSGARPLVEADSRRLSFDLSPSNPDALVMRARLLVEVVAAVNVSIMRRVRASIPPLYKSGIVYREEPPGAEEFENCLQALGLAPRVCGVEGAWVDCDGAVAYRLAELWLQGEPAKARILWRMVARQRKHAQIRRADGSIDDPCMVLRRNERERQCA